MMPQYGRQGLGPLAEDSVSPADSGRWSPELALSREGLPMHWLAAHHGLKGAEACRGSPAKMLAIGIPNDTASYKEGAQWHMQLALPMNQFIKDNVRCLSYGVNRVTRARRGSATVLLA